MKYIYILLAISSLASCSARQSSSDSATDRKTVSLETNSNGKGPVIEVDFYGGPSLYYPLMAVWIEDSEGKYIQTLYVPSTVATGVFRYGSNASGKWEKAARRAPQTLPYWSHKRGVQAPDGLFMPDPEHPVADAYSGATPTTSFTLKSRSDGPLPDRFRVMFEINQNWDWNEYWTNDKYPGDVRYLNSAQPAIVYEADVKSDGQSGSYKMKPVGHSHPTGETGELFTDLGTLTTALEIADSIIVRVSR